MNEPVDRWVDIAVSLCLIVLAGVVLWKTQGLPPGTFEPLGSAPMPQATAGIIALLSLVVIIRAVMRSDQGEATREPGRWLDAMGVTVLTLVYVAAMHGRLFGFAILTTVFLILTIGLLTRFQVRTLPWVVGIAAATGFGCQYLFTRVFIVDLPGL